MLDTGVCTTCGAENVDVDPMTEQCSDCSAALVEGGDVEAAEDLDTEIVDEAE
ncbi:hypothetical protein KJ611_03030 [Patescibacteria group bacterium]|nr:hypothetical protein [Patescibacteria group bacterium]MBU1705568.1 hypothetical protein [Patescibacteria group bacterium]